MGGKRCLRRKVSTLLDLFVSTICFFPVEVLCFSKRTNYLCEQMNASSRMKGENNSVLCTNPSKSLLQMLDPLFLDIYFPMAWEMWHGVWAELKV